MATLQTRGFQLSALPRAPNVPANIGNVDVKAIYEGVKQGLANYEMVRQAPQSMLLADAEMQSKTAEAPMGTAILAEQVKQAPLKTAVLAFEASPEMQAIKAEALKAKSVRPLTGTPYLLQRREELRRALAETPNDANLAAALVDTDLLLNKAGALSAADPTAERLTKTDIALEGNESRERVAAGDQAARRDVATETAKLRADSEAKGRSSREAIAEADRALRSRIASNQIAIRKQLSEDKTNAAKAKLGAVAKAQLNALNQRTKVIENSIEEALPDIGFLSAGFIGSPLSLIPGTPAKNVRRLLDAVKANIGFEELNNLRAQSPTGGALGQVTERELGFLQSVLGSIEQDQTPEQLKRNLESILGRYRELQVERNEAWERDFGNPAAPVAPQSAQTAPSATADFFEVGKTYRDTSGNRAVYRGDGKWEEVK